MLKKVIVTVILLCSCVMLLPAFESEASASGEYYVPYSEPTANDRCGYFNVDATNGYGTLYTYFWTMTPFSNGSGEDVSCEMYVRIDGNKVIFHPYLYGNGYMYFSLGYYDSNGGITFITYGGSSQNDYETVQQFAGINGISYGGNCSFGTGTYNGRTPLIHWNDSVDAQNLNTKLNAILNSLSNIDGDASTIINKLQDIYNQDVSINAKLSAMNTLLNEIKSEQKETNTWLEKIFDWLNESKEEERQEVTTQGGNSVSQGSDAIQNSGQGFSDGLGGLVSSMSYSGTECKWTFPEVRMPAIKGVMKETVLIEEQPIDFGVWIDAIPSNIMLLIRSVLTGALIIYCFKELYGTISYVLTLKGSGVNE